MNTPTSPAGLHRLDHLDPVEAIVAALNNPGTHPGWHRRALEQLAASMPLLDRALGRLRRMAAHPTQVTTTVRLPGRYWRGEDLDAGADVITTRDRARLHVRRAWVRELHHHGMRPLGWPPVTVTGHTYPLLSSDNGGPETWPTAPIEDAEMVLLTISGPAVPEAGAR